MGPHYLVQSLQVVCCADDQWYHKACLKQMAFTLADDFDCPSCDSRDEFRENMQANGIFIPSSTYMPKPVDMNQVPKPKRRRVHKNWVRERTFDSKSEALAFVKAEEIWSYFYKNEPDSGVCITYRCNLMKYGGEQCAAGLYLQYDSRKIGLVHLYRADSPHDHDNDEKKTNAVNRISGE